MTRRCTRCLYDDSIPGITFDARGVCSYCHLHDELDAQYPIGVEGRARLERLALRIKNDQAGAPYDVVVGVSGGCDSSYTLWLAHRLGLRILAVHFDNTWNGAKAVGNIKAMLRGTGADLWTYVVDNKEYDAITTAFLRSGVRDLEAPTDIALTTVLYRACEEFNVKYIFNGHSFRTEGIAPLGWSYMDGKYIADVCKRNGGPIRFHTFPNLWLRDFCRFSFLGIERVRPLYYIDYNKDRAKRELADAFGWRWYGGHHHENELTAFFMYHYLPTRFGIDLRALGWSAKLRDGQMNRADALERIAEPPQMNRYMLESVLDRLHLSQAEFDALMALPRHDERDYRTYKRTFELTRPLWWLLMKTGRVPASFYVKYAKKNIHQRRRDAAASRHPDIVTT